MDLLTKFENVEMKADTRISEADRIFCEAQQAAYDNARTSLTELGFIWDDMLSQQKELLAPTGVSPKTYLTSYNILETIDYDIRQQIHSLHPRFIWMLTSYFRKTYHFSINEDDILDHLIPQPPEDIQADDYKERFKQYAKDLDKLSLHYASVLEQIFLQTGRRTFFELALHELKDKCHQASWNPNNGNPQFEQKKSTIQFTDHTCSFRDWHSESQWSLSHRTKDILQGIAHFETDSFDTVPDSLSKVLKSYYSPDSLYEFPDCKKLHSLRIFKNGRVDLKFTSETYASQFVEDYLKTIC